MRTTDWPRQIQKVLDERQARKVEGVFLDMQTAQVLALVREKLSAQNRERLECMPLAQAADIAWKVFRRVSA